MTSRVTGQRRLQELIANGEGQSVEFKESLGKGAQLEGVESLVAFANADGGTVLFGVNDEGTIVGVQLGNKTLEDIANTVKGHTYPSLAAVNMEQAHNEEGRVVLIITVPQDSPPLIGAYLSSSSPLEPSRSVDASALKCLRRVGRTNQKTNLTLLRQSAPSDPEVIMRLNGGGRTAGRYFPKSCDFYYSNNGPGWAHNVSFRAEHAAYRVQAGPEGISLPPPTQEDPRHRAYPRKGVVATLDPDEQRAEAETPLHLRATYQDTRGITWQTTLELISTRRSEEHQLYDFQQGGLSKTIVGLPPKSSLE